MPPVPPDPARGRNPPRRARMLTVAARVMLVVIALAAGGYLVRQGELSKHLSASAPASASRTAGPDSSASALADSLAPRRSPASVASPVASPAPLPPVSAAPAIVQAIDLGDLPPPAGYTRETFSAARLGTTAGFAVALPPGWQSVPSRRQVRLEGPDGSLVEVDLTRHVRHDMVAEAKYLQAARGPDFPGYQRIYSPPGQPRKQFIQPVTIQQTLGALWEFDWVPAGGVQLREDVLLFNLGRQSYTIYTAGLAGRHDDDWNLVTLGTVSSILRTFTPVAS